jgi:hypothetical protein
MPESNYELERITKIAKEGLERDMDGGEDLRVDSFAIVVIYSTYNDQGQEEETVAVWSDSRRHFAKVGILHQGLERLSEHFYGDE